MSVGGKRVAVLHGVNFDVLERRDASLYGGLSLAELEYRIGGWAKELGFEAVFFQSNSEAEFCGFLHDLSSHADGALINAGAWTHYSRAIGDAFAVDPIPAVEVHLSDVKNREDWRKVTVFEGLIETRVFGLGVEGYKLALERLSGLLGDGDG